MTKGKEICFDMNIENLTNLLKSGEVLRYHTTPRVPAQTVAQHSWGVALIYRYLTGDESLYDALLHDSAELFVGDIPAPVKAYIGEQTHLIENLEIHYAIDAFGEYRESLCPLMHVADKLEALYWTRRADSEEGRDLNAKMADALRREISDKSFTEKERAKIAALMERWTYEANK